MERYICIHAHFYQPPRENPWLETIELQDSAYPYHDWNERVAAECYAPNATSRILGEGGRITRIVNNYAKISFNFGPTLLSWLQDHLPDVYKAVLEADRESRERFSGHGSALAQAYNHMILPLASRRDKVTQVAWGIRDFEHRFGRRPEGMWLPETAVDLETLEVLAEHEIRFTLLAPRQAHRVRPLGESQWQEVSGGAIDPAMPYVQNLPSGKEIVLFFYDDPISRAVAFEGLLESGESLVQRLMGGFSEERTWPQLVHIATDGESYGHHHYRGDMALAYALQYIENEDPTVLTVYGEYLDRHPTTHEVEIFENSSWSCVHGVERWRSDCGCSTGAHPGWNQKWRWPLREALDWLRDELSADYQAKAEDLLKDPDSARDDYIDLILDRSPASMDGFFKRHASRSLAPDEQITLLKIMELQRHAMLMYTSCGWFFDELSGIETVQVIQYAGRVIQLTWDIFGRELEPLFMERLEEAKSNIPEHRDGGHIYKRFVKPAVVNLEKAAAHFTMSSLFEEYGKEADVASYRIVREMHEKGETGKARLAVGRIRVASKITGEAGRYAFGILHWGELHLSGCVIPCEGEEPEPAFVRRVFEVFARADFSKTLQILEKRLGNAAYSLRDLFRDEQRKIFSLVHGPTLRDTEAVYKQIYENHIPLLRFLTDLDIPRPKALKMAADLVFNEELRRTFEKGELDVEDLEGRLKKASLEGISFDAETLEMPVRKKLEYMIGDMVKKGHDLSGIEKMNAVLDILAGFPIEINLREVQNRYFKIWEDILPELQKRTTQGEKEAGLMVEQFKSLGERLSIWVDDHSNP